MASISDQEILDSGTSDGGTETSGDEAVCWVTGSDGADGRGLYHQYNPPQANTVTTKMINQPAVSVFAWLVFVATLVIMDLANKN
jgi:hypothetical protein